MEDNRVGDIAESAILHECLQNDLDVSIPYGDFPYDLVVEIDDELQRVQIKNAYDRSDKQESIAVSLKGKYDVDDYDVLAIYYPRTEQTFYEWADDVGTHKFSLSLANPEDMAPHHRANAKFAEDYTIERLIN